MDDNDQTMTVPRPVPPEDRVSDSQMGALLPPASELFETRDPSAPARQWEPPPVDELQKMLPQYEVSHFLARGGMGAVYKGSQPALKRSVAIKVLPPAMLVGGDEMQFAARFKQEAQAMARLSHPNIVAVFDAGETAEGLLYFVMEYVEGTDVAQILASESRLDVERTVRIVTAVCEALAFAHEEGIIHRDIKPSNIMIDQRGRVKVADFGLAKAVNMESTLMTRSDVAMGTPDFVAPEALIPGAKVDGRADIYAVGVMLYQMLTGKVPRGRFELPSQVVPKLHKGFDAIIDRAMQTDRERRYSTAVEMKEEMQTLLTPGLPPARPGRGAIPSHMASITKDRQRLLLCAATVAVAAGVFLFNESTKIRNDEKPLETKSSTTVESVRLWDSSEKLLNQSGANWVNGSITLHNASLRHPSRSRDLVFRASIRVDPNVEHSQLHVRSQFERSRSDPKRDSWYAVGMTSKHDGIMFIRRVPGDSQMVKSWRLPRTYQAGEWIKLEIRAEGPLFTVSADGELLGTATDNSIKEQGGVVIANQKEGHFREIEFVNLDRQPAVNHQPASVPPPY